MKEGRKLKILHIDMKGRQTGKDYSIVDCHEAQAL